MKRFYLIINDGSKASVYNAMVTKRLTGEMLNVKYEDFIEIEPYDFLVFIKDLIEGIEAGGIPKEQIVVMLPITYENLDKFTYYNRLLWVYGIKSGAPSKGLTKEMLEEIV